MDDQHHRHIVPGNPPKMRVFSDKVDQIKEGMTGMDDMIEAVDMNGGRTGMGKKPDDLEATEDNIRWRFDLNPSKVQRSSEPDQF